MQSNLVELVLIMKKDNLSIKEISEKINKSQSTVRRCLKPYGLKDRSEAQKESALKGSLKGSLKMKEMYALKRKAAYDSVQSNIQEDLKDRILRDFINIYIGEGSKRRDTEIAVTNSDFKTILLCLTAMKKFFLKEGKKIIFNVCYYKENNNEKELVNYWSKLLKNNSNVDIRSYIQPTVKAIGHNNSNQYCLIKIAIYDTYAKQKLNAYMDYVKEEWVRELESIYETKVIEIEKKE